MIAAATVIVALVIGSIGTAAGLLRARRAEHTAVAEAQAAVEARDEADEVAAFLVGIVAAADPWALAADKPPGEVTALEILARGAERIETDLVDRPIAGYSMSLAADVASQGRLEEAAGIFENVERAVRRRYGDAHPLRGTVLQNLGVLHRDLKQYERSEEYFRQALAILEAALGSEHPQVGYCLNGLARTVSERGRDDEAWRLQERALAICESTLGAEHPWIASSLDHLATLATRRGDHQLARRHARRAYDIQVAQLDPGHRDIGRAAALLGETLWQLGLADEARQRFDEARRIFAADRESMANELEDLDERIDRLGASS